MSRRSRNPPGGFVYHILNRANRRETLFDSAGDYCALLRVVRETLLSYPMRILEYCLMPNHWHFMMWPQEDGQLAAFMHHMTTTHASRWNKWRGLTGHIYQGPYKGFPVEQDDHYYTLARYIVRNPRRANLVTSAEAWPWSSLQARTNQTQWASLLSDGPLRLPSNWIEYVNQPQTDAELAAIRRHIARGQPFGEQQWSEQVAKQLGIEELLRRPGRPRQEK